MYNNIFKIFIFLLLLTSCINTNTNNTSIFQKNENATTDIKVLKIKKKYDEAIQKYKNNEDVNAINMLLQCIKDIEDNKITTNILDINLLKKQVKDMISLIHIDIINNNNLKNTVYTYRKEKNKIINLSNTKLNVSFISDKTYSQEFITDNNGYVEINPFFMDLKTHGKILINFIINDDLLKNINSIEFEFNNIIVNKKIAFINYIKDINNNFIDTKKYDDYFINKCSNFINLSVIKMQYDKITDIPSFYNNNLLLNIDYVIVNEIKIEKIISFWDKEIATATFNLSIIDNNNKKIIKEWNISHNSKVDNKNAIDSVLYKCYDNISVLSKNEIIKILY